MCFANLANCRAAKGKRGGGHDGKIACEHEVNKEGVVKESLKPFVFLMKRRRTGHVAVQIYNAKIKYISVDLVC